MIYESLPEELSNDLQEVLKIIPKETYNNVNVGYSEDKAEYCLNSNIIRIPYRMYFNDIEVEKIDNLTVTQKEILYCFYTRSCDGHIREKYLRKLLKTEFDYWAIPFIVKLSDEYIVEILQVIYDNLKDRDNDDIKRFCCENKSAISKNYSRMISYWNEFYRDKEPNFHKYVGRKLFRDCFGYNRTFEKWLIKGVDPNEWK